eukprot:CAMPEP_0204388560 /NCGR_PEP_ID=MMETSP0469-20131031/59604_1 /ASSEMBLY_ACC=CAM_ASM_000384 /TAXON_ID=2969 /ORGANISM="Oxyrrhis marina" /LENGTH=55 /DNA_ID=CAMNT_0051382111 /DNA_START=102 /DNA_END=265 /DNA_ORIENTATION=+
MRRTSTCMAEIAHVLGAAVSLSGWPVGALDYGLGRSALTQFLRLLETGFGQRFRA